MRPIKANRDSRRICSAIAGAHSPQAPMASTPHFQLLSGAACTRRRGGNSRMRRFGGSREEAQLSPVGAAGPRAEEGDSEAGRLARTTADCGGGSWGIRRPYARRDLVCRFGLVMHDLPSRGLLNENSFHENSLINWLNSSVKNIYFLMKLFDSLMKIDARWEHIWSLYDIGIT